MNNLDLLLYLITYREICERVELSRKLNVGMKDSLAN